MPGAGRLRGPEHVPEERAILSAEEMAQGCSPGLPDEGERRDEDRAAPWIPGCAAVPHARRADPRPRPGNARSGPGPSRSVDDGLPGRPVRPVPAARTENDPRPLYRAYSMASPPSRSNRLSLLFARVPDGACTSYVFGQLQAGERVTINGPFGFFRSSGEQPEGSSSSRAARGSRRSGQSWRTWRRSASPEWRHSSILLTRWRTSCTRRICAPWSDRCPDFRFIPVLSRPSPGPLGRGARRSAGRALPSPARLDGHEAYLCGGPGLIDASISAMKSQGSS